MARLTLFCLLLALPEAAQGQDKGLEQALALQRVMHKTIAEAEPSIVCILVSRSEAYGRPAGGARAADAGGGKLGDFDPLKFDFLWEEKSKEERLLARRQLDLADPAHIPEAFGSGVVIDASGLILTNYHVVRDATRVFIRFPGGKGTYADIHAADPRCDLAVLRIRDRRLMPLKAITLAEDDKIERGQMVLTLSNPYASGFRDGQPSASWGIISNMRRRIAGQPREEERTRPLHYYGTLLQTDTRVHLGCSGGALLDMNGKLIGLTTALAAIHGSETPGGFAVPLDTGMRRLVDVLRRGEEIDYGFLGVAFNEQRPELGKGVTVEYVTPGSPADMEGHLRPHDIIVAVNGAPVQESDDLFLQLGTRLAGTRVVLQVLHAATREIGSVEVTLGKFHVTGKKIASSLGKRPFFRGLRVDYATLLAQQPPRLARIPAGVLVSDIQADTPAAQAKLKPGEVITHVNNRPVNTPLDFYQAVAGLVAPAELQLYNFGSQEPPARVLLKAK